MIRKIIRPPKQQSPRGVLETMLDIAEGRPPAPGAPTVYLYVLERRRWEDWEMVTVWYTEDSRRRVRRWLVKIGLLPTKKSKEVKND